jgi:hypothetical protein
MNLISFLVSSFMRRPGHWKSSQERKQGCRKWGERDRDRDGILRLFSCLCLEDWEPGSTFNKPVEVLGSRHGDWQGIWSS